MMEHRTKVQVAAVSALLGGAVACAAYVRFRTWAKANKPQCLFSPIKVLSRWAWGKPATHPKIRLSSSLVNDLHVADLCSVLSNNCHLPEGDDAVEFTFVDTQQGLREAVQYMQQCQVLAVDVEVHQIWTFRELICLIQIAGHGVCYVIDALALHDSLDLLKKPFEDPNILKLLHGARGDIQWLQAVGLFLCNVVDTCELALEAMAAGVFAKANLKYVLHRLYGVDVDKDVALSDWRRRPLLHEQLQYGARDVLYLHAAARDLLHLLLVSGGGAASAKAASSSMSGAQEEPALEADAGRTSLTGGDDGEPVAEASTMSVGGGVNDAQNGAGGANGEARVHAAVKRSQTMAFTVFPERAPIFTMSDREQVRSAFGSIFNSMEEHHKSRCADRDEVFAPREHLRPLIAAICWWRVRAARLLDINPLICIPNRVVESLALKAPTTGAGVYKVMTDWVEYHRTKHAARLAAQADDGEWRQPMADPLDAWEPNLFHRLSAWHLARLLRRVAAGKTPAEIDIILAAKARGRKHRGGVHRRGGARMRAKKEKLVEQRAAASSAREQSRQDVIDKFKAKKPVYSNCRMLAMDGTELAACDLKKLQWYVGKGIAEWEPGCGEESEQPTIRLNFVHRQDDQEGDTAAFYTGSRENRCVGCGTEDHYLKYKIVPDCYRKHFPEAMKSHRSHDIVLLCIDCHSKAHTGAERIKRSLAEAHGVPLYPTQRPPGGGRSGASTPDLIPRPHSAPPASPGREDVPSECSPAHPNDARVAAQSGGGEVDSPQEDDIVDVSAGNAHKAAVVLDKERQLPAERRLVLEQTVLTYVRGKPVPRGTPMESGDLEAGLLAGLSSARRNKTLRKLLDKGRPAPSGYVVERHANGRVTCESAEHAEAGHRWHGRCVVQKVIEQESSTDALQELVVRFREQFLQDVQPEWLPPSWDVHHAAKRHFGEHSVYAEPPAPQQNGMENGHDAVGADKNAPEDAPAA